MKIIVTTREGRREQITLTEPIVLIRSEKLNVLRTATCTSHFFDHEGYYDGWGMHLGDGLPQEDAYKIAAEVQKDQEMPSAASEGGSNGNSR